MVDQFGVFPFKEREVTGEFLDEFFYLGFDVPLLEEGLLDNNFLDFLEPVLTHLLDMNIINLYIELLDVVIVYLS